MSNDLKKSSWYGFGAIIAGVTIYIVLDVMIRNLVGPPKTNPPPSSAIENYLREVAEKDGKAKILDGRSALDRQEYDLAIASFDAAIKANPKLAEAYFYRSIAYKKKGDQVRSIMDYEEAIRLDPALAKRDKP